VKTTNFKAMTPRHLFQASVAVALVTMAIKTMAWWMTGSVGLLSDAMESLVNLAGAMFGLWMVTIAARPADEDHPYGHHKAEYFSAGFEGILIVLAAMGILWAALDRWLTPQPLQSLDIGLALSVLASVLNGGLAWLMLGAARHHRSVALEGDARHLMTDVWTSVGVIVGVTLAWASGWLWLDPVVAMLVALNILREGARLVWQASQGLMDEAVDPSVQAQIQAVLDHFSSQQGGVDTVRFDHLVTRKAGQRCYVDMHMHMPSEWTLGHAATLRVQVERELMAVIAGVSVSIQILPKDVDFHKNG
jgi:cation diffusion facilitator family transporter